METLKFPFTLEQLLMIRVIAIKGSLKTAAFILYTTEPIITLKVGVLEKRLKTVVFDSFNNQIKLTRSGYLLLRYSDKIFFLCNKSYKELDNLYPFEIRELNTGTSKSYGVYLIPSTVNIYKTCYPLINTNVKISDSREILWNLMNGLIDIGVIDETVPSFLNNLCTIYPFLEDQLTLVSPFYHPFVKYSSISREDLYALRFVFMNSSSLNRVLLDNVLTRNGIDINRFKVVMEFSSTDSVIKAVQFGFGVSFISILTIKKELDRNLMGAIDIAGLRFIRLVLALVSF